jgi:hypothetical protein
MIVGAPLSCRRLVGRERESVALRERFQEAERGRGSLVIVGPFLDAPNPTASTA